MNLSYLPLQILLSSTLFVSVAVAATVPAAVTNANVAKGDEYLNNDRLERAIESYKLAVKEQPQSSITHQRLGHALSLAAELPQAAEEERKALNLDQDNGEAHCNLGWIFGLQQKYRAAIEEEKLAIALDPSNGFAYSILGLSLASLEDYDLAISAFNKAIELDPQDVNSCLNLAAALGRKKDYRTAVAMYRKAVELDRANDLGYLGLGAALGKVGDLKGQVQAYEQAVAIAPMDPASHGRLGWALSQLGDWRASFREGAVANGLRLKTSSTKFFKMFLTVWAAIFVIFGALFAVIFSGSRFKPQPGETVVKSFFLTFYKDKPGRFVLTNRRIVFVPEAFSKWFGSTRVSVELDQINEVQAHSAMSGGRLSVLSADGSVLQFSMPNLVLEPLTKQLKALAVAQEQAEQQEQEPVKEANGTAESSPPAVAKPIAKTSIFEEEIDDKDAVIITVVAHESDVKSPADASSEKIASDGKTDAEDKTDKSSKSAKKSKKNKPAKTSENKTSKTSAVPGSPQAQDAPKTVDSDEKGSA